MQSRSSNVPKNDASRTIQLCNVDYQKNIPELYGVMNEQNSPVQRPINRNPPKVPATPVCVQFTILAHPLKGPWSRGVNEQIRGVRRAERGQCARSNVSAPGTGAQIEEQGVQHISPGYSSGAWHITKLLSQNTTSPRCSKPVTVTLQRFFQISVFLIPID